MSKLWTSEGLSHITWSVCGRRLVQVSWSYTLKGNLMVWKMGCRDLPGVRSQRAGSSRWIEQLVETQRQEKTRRTTSGCCVPTAQLQGNTSHGSRYYNIKHWKRLHHFNYFQPCLCVCGGGGAIRTTFPCQVELGWKRIDQTAAWS